MLHPGVDLTRRICCRRHLNAVGINSSNFLAENQPEISDKEGRDVWGLQKSRNMDKRRSRRMQRASAKMSATNTAMRSRLSKLREVDIWNGNGTMELPPGLKYPGIPSEGSGGDAARKDADADASGATKPAARGDGPADRRRSRSGRNSHTLAHTGAPTAAALQQGSYWQPPSLMPPSPTTRPTLPGVASTTSIEHVGDIPNPNDWGGAAAGATTPPWATTTHLKHGAKTRRQRPAGGRRSMGRPMDSVIEMPDAAYETVVSGPETQDNVHGAGSVGSGVGSEGSDGGAGTMWGGRPAVKPQLQRFTAGGAPYNTAQQHPYVAPWLCRGCAAVAVAVWLWLCGCV